MDQNDLIFRRQTDVQTFKKDKTVDLSYSLYS